MSKTVINPTVLEPLFGPSDLPNRYRVRSDTPGGQAQIVNGRRPTKILIAQNLRQAVAEWRAADYPYAGASDTTRELLLHWFGSDHEITVRRWRRSPVQLLLLPARSYRNPHLPS
jgi:type III restriction enzyme